MPNDHVIKFKVEIFMNETDSVLLHGVYFIAFIGNAFRVTRHFDEPIFNMNEVHKIIIEKDE